VSAHQQASFTSEFYRRIRSRKHGRCNLAPGINLSTRFAGGWSLAACLLLLLFAFPQFACAQGSQQQDLTKLDLEDLMKVEVISVSKHDQTLSETAAAVFVISPEDIRHSGATNLPDLLRMVPGVYVAQINANTWAISIRGFNGRFSREVLVLVDGRTVYSPTFGGVFWDVLELPLTDLEKIEVVRGPGGSVWGTNAVNGVINIITKKASKTQGTLLEVGGGNLEQGFATLEHGGKIGESLDYRGFLSYQNNGSMEGVDGQPGDDSWRQVRGGFRIDARLSLKDKLSVQGDLYSVRENQPRDVPPSLTSPVPLSSNLEANLGGGFLMSTWDHSFSARSSTTLLVSYQRYVRTDILKEASGTLDFDFQNNLAVGERQQIVWGLGFRNIAAQDTNNSLVSILPPYRNTNRYSGFFQYQIDLASDRIHLTFGTKLEVNPYTGIAAMPTARIAWAPTGSRTLWAAFSRALRTPADSDEGARFNEGEFTGPGGVPVLISYFGNPQLQNEEVLSYEAGYRTVIRKNLSIDLALYYNNYSNQLAIQAGTPFLETSPPPTHIVQPLSYQNLEYGEAHGVEIYANWKIANRWTISPGYAYELIHLNLMPSAPGLTGMTTTGQDTPGNSAQVRNHISLPHCVSWDTSIYYTGALQSPHVPSYTRLDTGLTWQWKQNLSISAFGQDLLQQQHLEFVDTSGSVRSTLIPRSAYIKLIWRF
jgi:iron complex outermembrane recepter protein